MVKHIFQQDKMDLILSIMVIWQLFDNKLINEDGTLKAVHALIDGVTNSTLTINKGKYIRNNESATGSEDGFVIGRAGKITIRDAHIESDATYAVVSSMSDSGTVINIYNSTIKTGPYQSGSIVNRSEGTTINVYNSTISAPQGVITTVTSEKKLDFYEGTGNFYYSPDVVFSNKTNTPDLTNFTGIAEKTDLACGE